MILRLVSLSLSLVFFFGQVVWGHSISLNRLPALRPAAGSLIIHIQDVHSHFEAQSDISKTVAELAHSNKIDLIALEGLFGPVDLSRFQTYTPRSTIQSASDFLLKTGKISGAVHAALTANSIPALVGIDDKKQYDANVEAYRQASETVPLVKRWLSAAQKESVLKKKREFNSALAKLDRLVWSYRNSKIKLGDYLIGLAEHAPYARDSMTAVFIETLSLEKSIDFDALRKKVDAIKNRTIDPSTIEKDPLLINYLAYRAKADSLSADQLFSELEKLEQRAYEMVIRTPRERVLVKESDQLYLISKLIDFSLTKAEWEKYALTLTLSPRGEGTQLFEKFYTVAEKRDQLMAENLLRQMKKTGAKRVLLVAGGFHKEGMDSYFRQAGIEIQHRVPNMSAIETEKGSAYLTAFQREKTPLDRLFHGRSLFVVPNPADVGALPFLGLADERLRNPDRPFSEEQKSFEQLAGPAGAGVRVETRLEDNAVIEQVSHLSMPNFSIEVDLDRSGDAVVINKMEIRDSIWELPGLPGFAAIIYPLAIALSSDWAAWIAAIIGGALFVAVYHKNKPLDFAVRLVGAAGISRISLVALQPNVTNTIGFFPSLILVIAAAVLLHEGWNALVKEEWRLSSRSGKPSQSKTIREFERLIRKFESRPKDPDQPYSGLIQSFMDNRPISSVDSFQLFDIIKRKIRSRNYELRLSLMVALVGLLKKNHDFEPFAVSIFKEAMEHASHDKDIRVRIRSLSELSQLEFQRLGFSRKKIKKFAQPILAQILKQMKTMNSEEAGEHLLKVEKLIDMVPLSSWRRKMVSLFIDSLRSIERPLRGNPVLLATVVASFVARGFVRSTNLPELRDHVLRFYPFVGVFYRPLALLLVDKGLLSKAEVKHLKYALPDHIDSAPTEALLRFKDGKHESKVVGWLEGVAEKRGYLKNPILTMDFLQIVDGKPVYLPELPEAFLENNFDYDIPTNSLRYLSHDIHYYPIRLNRFDRKGVIVESIELMALLGEPSLSADQQFQSEFFLDGFRRWVEWEVGGRKFRHLEFLTENGVRVIPLGYSTSKDRFYYLFPATGIVYYTEVESAQWVVQPETVQHLFEDDENISNEESRIREIESRAALIRDMRESVRLLSDDLKFDYLVPFDRQVKNKVVKNLYRSVEESDEIIYYNSFGEVEPNEMTTSTAWEAILELMASPKGWSEGVAQRFCNLISDATDGGSFIPSMGLIFTRSGVDWIVAETLRRARKPGNGYFPQDVLAWMKSHPVGQFSGNGFHLDEAEEHSLLSWFGLPRGEMEFHMGPTGWFLMTALERMQSQLAFGLIGTVKNDPENLKKIIPDFTVNHSEVNAADFFGHKLQLGQALFRNSTNDESDADRPHYVLVRIKGEAPRKLFGGLAKEARTIAEVLSLVPPLRRLLRNKRVSDFTLVRRDADPISVAPDQVHTEVKPGDSLIVNLDVQSIDGRRNSPPAAWGLWTRSWGFSPEAAIRFIGPGVETTLLLAVFVVSYATIRIVFPYMGHWLGVALAIPVVQLFFLLGGLTGVYVRNETTNQWEVVSVTDVRSPPLSEIIYEHLLGIGLRIPLPFYISFGIAPYVEHELLRLVIFSIGALLGLSIHLNHQPKERIFNVKVRPDLSFDVRFAEGVLEPENPTLIDQIGDRKVMFVVRGKTAAEKIKAYMASAALQKGYKFQGYNEDDNLIEAMESVVENFHKSAAAFGLSRKDVVVVVGDSDLFQAMGFARTRFHRGIPEIRIPITSRPEIDFDVDPGTRDDGAVWSPESILLDPLLMPAVSMSAIKSSIEEYPHEKHEWGYRIPFFPNYDYVVEMTRGVFHEKNPLLNKVLKDRNTLVVIDEFVGPETIAQLRAKLETLDPSLKRGVLVLPGGESIKNQHAARNIRVIHQSAHQMGLGKEDAIVAIGGGALVDLVGFAAARFKRGIPLVRIPTTLLAQVDGSIGAKNAINRQLKQGAGYSKNFDGLFATPYYVIVDPTLLKTLPRKQLVAGTAEMIKVGLMKDAGYIEQLEEGHPDLLNLNISNRSKAEELMARSIQLHTDQIQLDPFEMELARPLDYGHEYAHPLERLTNFELSHGEAVAIGTAISTVISFNRGAITEQELERVLTLIQNHELPIFHRMATVDNLFPALKEFQEHLGGEFTVSLLGAIGVKRDVHHISREELDAALKFLKARTNHVDVWVEAGLNLDEAKFLIGSVLLYEGDRLKSIEHLTSPKAPEIDEATFRLYARNYWIYEENVFENVGKFPEWAARRLGSDFSGALRTAYFERTRPQLLAKKETVSRWVAERPIADEPVRESGFTGRELRLIEALHSLIIGNKTISGQRDEMQEVRTIFHLISDEPKFYPEHFKKIVEFRNQNREKFFYFVSFIQNILDAERSAAPGMKWWYFKASDNAWDTLSEKINKERAQKSLSNYDASVETMKLMLADTPSSLINILSLLIKAINETDLSLILELDSATFQIVDDKDLAQFADLVHEPYRAMIKLDAFSQRYTGNKYPFSPDQTMDPVNINLLLRFIGDLVEPKLSAEQRPLFDQARVLLRDIAHQLIEIERSRKKAAAVEDVLRFIILKTHSEKMKLSTEESTRLSKTMGFNDLLALGTPNDVRAEVSRRFAQTEVVSFTEITVVRDEYGNHRFTFKPTAQSVPFPGIPPETNARLMEAFGYAFDLLFNKSHRIWNLVWDKSEKFSLVVVKGKYQNFTTVPASEVYGQKDHTRALPDTVRTYYLPEKGPSTLGNFVNGDLVSDLIKEVGNKGGNGIDLVAFLRERIMAAYQFEHAKTLKEIQRPLMTWLSSARFIRFLELGRTKMLLRTPTDGPSNQWRYMESKPIAMQRPESFVVWKNGGGLRDFIANAEKIADKKEFVIYPTYWKYADRLWFVAIRNGRPELFYTSTSYSNVAGQFRFQHQEAAMGMIKDGLFVPYWYAKPLQENAHELSEACSNAVGGFIQSGQMHLDQPASIEQLISDLHVDLGLAFDRFGKGLSRDKNGEVRYGNNLGLEVDIERYAWLYMARVVGLISGDVDLTPYQQPEKPVTYDSEPLAFQQIRNMSDPIEARPADLMSFFPGGPFYERVVAPIWESGLVIGPLVILVPWLLVQAGTQYFRQQTMLMPLVVFAFPTLVPALSVIVFVLLIGVWGQIFGVDFITWLHTFVRRDVGRIAYWSHWGGFGAATYTAARLIRSGTIASMELSDVFLTVSYSYVGAHMLVHLGFGIFKKTRADQRTGDEPSSNGHQIEIMNGKLGAFRLISAQG